MKPYFTNRELEHTQTAFKRIEKTLEQHVEMAAGDPAVARAISESLDTTKELHNAIFLKMDATSLVTSLVSAGEHAGKVSDWIVVDDYCAARIREGGDINKVADRVAFIEKTPRVRIRPMPMNRSGTDFDWTKDHINWAECPGRGNNGFDVESRLWCDQMLTLLGYKI